jgi:hypothetical protein
MSRPDAPCCNNCRFYTGMECRRRAPQAVFVQSNPDHHIASWPRVYEGWRVVCGEHEALPPKEPQP